MKPLAKQKAGWRLLSHDLFDLFLIQGALDSLGVALADHHHQWSEGEHEIYEQATKTITSWVADCKEIDSSASVISCSLLPLLELRLRDGPSSIQSLASGYSLWRVVSVALHLVMSTSYLRFRCFCSYVCCCVKNLLSNDKGLATQPAKMNPE